MPNLDESSASRHTSDPAFFKLPSDPMDHHPTGKDIARMIRSTRRGRRIDLSTVESLLRVATASRFQRLPSIVTLPPLTDSHKLHVVGDLHGSLSDLEAVLGFTGEPGVNNLILFNGDLADRGDNGIEIISTVCALSLAYPDCVYVNRGNHEDLALSVAYGLAAEVQFKYGSAVFRERLAPLLDEFFMCLPLATVVEDDAFIVHAGPPPPGIPLKTIQDSFRWDGCRVSRTIRTNAKYHGVDWGRGEDFESLCAQDHAVEEMLETMLWSDPDIDEFNGTLMNSGRTKNVTPVWSANVSRGAGYRFDAQIVRQFLNSSGLKRLIRSHEPMQRGCTRYEILSDDDNGVPLEFFTVFSASRYPYKEGFNFGAVLTLMAKSRHRIVRYATDDDEPLMSFADLLAKDAQKLSANIDAVALRRSLRAALATRRVAFERELEEMARWRGEDVDSLPFEDTIDALFRTLNLRGEGLLQDGPRRAIALALEPDLAPDQLPASVDILKALDSFAEEDRKHDDCSDYQGNSWLQAVFSLIDVSNEDWISRKEWNDAVATVNESLPPGTEKIDAHETWDLLDQNGDGKLSPWEWNALGAVMCR